MTQTLHYRKLPVLALLLSLLFLGGTAMAQKTWSGGATGNWNVGGNWTPAGVPGAGDDVTINTASTITLDVSPTINSLTISGGVLVTFQVTGASRTLTIDNTGSSIGTGSTLELQGDIGGGPNRTLTVQYTGVGRTMTIDGTLVLSEVDGVIYNATNSVTTVNGTLRAALTAGTTAPTITSTATNLLFATGGTYDHEIAGGTIPIATWNANSTLEFSGGGNTTPAGITAANTTFGKILVTNNTTATIGGGGGVPNQILTVSNGTGDDLVVNGGSTLVLATSMENVVLATGATASIAGTVTSNSAYNTSAGVTTVSGTFTNANALSNLGTAANLSIANGATYRHGYDGGTTPTATWAGGNLSISGITNAAPTIVSGFNNLTWECAGQAIDIALNQNISVPGSMTISNTGGNQLILTNNATSRTLTVTGTLNVTNAGEFYGSSVGTGSATINVGTYFQSGGGSLFIIADGPNALPSTMTVANSFSQTDGDFRVVDGTGNGTLSVGAGLAVSGPALFRNVSGGGVGTVNVGVNFSQSGTSTVTFKEGVGNATMNVGNNFIQSAGTFNQRGNATGTSDIVVTGNFEHTGGAYNFSSTTAPSTLTVAGNFTNSGGTMTQTGGAGSAGNIIFNGTNSQLFTSGTTVTNNINYTVNTGAILQMAATATVVNGASFTLQTDATLGIRAADGIATAGAAGNIRTTARTFPADANYLYNGTVAQTSLGTGFPTNLTGDLIINNTLGATLSLARTIASGGLVNLLGGTFNSGAGLLTLAAGSLIERNAGTMTGTIAGASGVYNVRYVGGDKTTGLELQGGAAGVNKLGNLEINLNGATDRVDIGGPFELTGNLTFTQGRLAAISPNVLTMTEAATHSGAGPNSFYLGPMLKRGVAAFVFPIGSGSTGYRPVAFSGSNTAIGTAIGTAATVEAQTVGLNPLKQITPKTFTGGLISISSCYYWNIQLVAGGGSPIHVWGSTGTGGGAFATDFLRSCMTDLPPIAFPAINPANLVVSKHDGLSWTNLGQNAQVEVNNAWFISATTATPSFSPFVIGSTEAVLPVTFTAFSALKDGGSVKLSWETASEQNSDYYDVERSSDGVNFSSIGKVAAAGNSTTTRKYSFTDNNPVAGRNFYRLRQVDLDTRFDYSKTVSVNMMENAAVSIYPNPVQTDVMVEYPKVGRGAIYKVIGMDGRVMISGNLQENSSQQRINLNNLQRGNYILLIQNDGQQYQQKIVKL